MEYALFTLLPCKVSEPVWGTAAEMRFVFRPIKCYQGLSHHPEPPVFMVSQSTITHPPETHKECGEVPGGSSYAEGVGYSYRHSHQHLASAQLGNIRIWDFNCSDQRGTRLYSCWKSSCFSFIINSFNSELMKIKSPLHPQSQSGQTDFFRGLSASKRLKQSEQSVRKLAVSLLSGHGLSFMSPVKPVSWLAEQRTPAKKGRRQLTMLTVNVHSALKQTSAMTWSQ